MKEESLIFIVSQPRSGSTFLQRLISNHEKVNTTSEHWLMLNFANQLKPELVSTRFSNSLSNQAFNIYKEKYPELSFGEQMKAFILGLYDPLMKDFEFVIDKTPRYWEIIQELAQWFPKSKIIVLQRHPLDVATSMVKTWGISSLSKLNIYRRDLLLAPKELDEFLEAQKENPNIYGLTYEELLTDTEGKLKYILDWIGLDYHPSMLNVDANNKIKGAFGDPYQNKEHQESMTTNQSFEDSDQFKEFLSGYANYLGRDYFDRFKKRALLSVKDTSAFRNFLQLGEQYEEGFFASTDEKLEHENRKLRSDLALMKNSSSYKLGRLLLSPFRLFKRS
ncbi:MAG: sulfotransferase [Bacteroidota bacterium]